MAKITIQSKPLTKEILNHEDIELEEFDYEWTIILYTTSSEYDATGYSTREELYEELFDRYVYPDYGSDWRIYGIYNQKKPKNVEVEINFNIE